MDIALATKGDNVTVALLLFHCYLLPVVPHFFKVAIININRCTICFNLYVEFNPFS